VTEAAPRLRVRLWMKLAALAAAGVVAMHSVHLVIGNRIAAHALLLQQERLGHDIARLTAEQAADPLLVGDFVSLHSLATTTAAAPGVAYCFVSRDGRVLASSFEGGTPSGLLTLRAAGDRESVVVADGPRRILDLAQPVLGDVGEIRLGLEMDAVAQTRRRLAVHLGLLALGVIGAGLATAVWLARGIARPVQEMVQAADRFDPAVEPVPMVRPRGTDEIADLGGRFNRMLVRLRGAHLEQERVRRMIQQTERMVALGSLVAGVAHEVNNPLAGLKNCVHRLSRADLGEAKRGEYLQLMDEGLGRIEHVVKGLLDFGRPHPPLLAPTPASELARGALHVVEPLLAGRHVGCTVEDAHADGPVDADAHRVGQALVNLLLNAAFVTPAGGRIRLRLRRRDGQRGIAVEDEGPGIPPELRERVFDPFFTTKPPGEGSGLGLSVARSIVDAHGGELSFEFPPGGGTVATVWLRESADGRAVGPMHRTAGRGKEETHS